ncbi:hypothetical protein HIM_02293 [Hirsutella minnesotensis 3608]|nr:hypothetical protein HIM_02293 [Hirsutella minnesotensis 3608]
MASIEAFKKAAEDSKKLTAKPSNDELLELYALYKIGNGEDFNKAPAPGMLDLKASADSPPVDEQITPEGAREQYVKLVETLKEKYGYDANKVPEAVGN